MQNYRTSSHCTYDIKYHIVWITKYRKPILTGKIAERTREIIRQVCSSNEVEILSGHVGKDHIHLLVSVPPHLSVSRLVQYMKGNTSYKMQKEFKELNQQYWGRHMWARGYFVASSGNVTDEIIAEYIKNQDLEERRNSDNFYIKSTLGSFSRRLNLPPLGGSGSVTVMSSNISKNSLRFSKLIPLAISE